MAETNPIHSTDAAGRPTKKEEVNSQNIPLDPPKLIEQALAQLETAIGGRDQLVSGLSMVPGMTQEEQTILYLLADPANAKKSLASLVGRTGTTVGRVLELFCKGDFAEAYVRSIRRVYRMLPSVAEDAMSRAVGKWKTCFVCKGKGSLPPKVEGEDGAACLDCEGLGRVDVAPDVERVKVALQIGGLLKTGGGVVVDASTKTQINNGPVVLVKSSPDFRTATDRLLYPGRAAYQLKEAEQQENFIVEAEVVAEEEVPAVQPTPDQQ